MKIVEKLLQQNSNVSVSIDIQTLREFFQEVAEEILEKKIEESANINTEKYLTIDEVVKMCGVTKPTLWRWNKIGYLTKFKIGGSKVRYRLSDVQRIMKGGCHEDWVE